MIRLESISKKFGDNSVLENVNMEIADGKIVGLFGDSGVGKSTLARILTGLVSPDLGRVTVDDEVLVSTSIPYSREIGKRIQLVPQHPYEILDPTQKVGKGIEEIVRFLHLAKGKEVRGYVKGRACEVELDESILGHLPHQISGGEAERVALAKALLFSPHVLILDEATAMLDALTETNVLDLILRKHTERGFSVLMISHNAKLLNSRCDEIYKIKDKTTVLTDKIV